MFQVPLGRSQVSFEVPATMTVDVVEASAQPALADPIAAIQQAIENPIGTPPLATLAAGRRNAVIVVTDATRLCPDHLLVPPMARALESAGLRPDDITIIVAVGTHRPSTPAEKVEKLGAAIVDRYRVIDHDAADLDNLVELQAVGEGPPFTVNRQVFEADLLVATGVVEPHQYAGYSGGAKTVSIGTAGEEIIQYTHGPAFLDHPGTRLGKLEGNLFQHAVREVGKAIGLDFAINAVLNGDGEIVDVAAGAPNLIHDHLSASASTIYTSPIPHQYDIAVAGVGYPKDANLYQASRAASYLQYAPTPVVREGGVIILPAECPEGPGQGAGEQRFAKAMTDAASPADLIAKVRREGLRPGEQRGYVMANVLEHCHVIVAGAEDPGMPIPLGFESARTIEDAFQQARRWVGDSARVLIVPHALLTLPIVQV